MFQEIYKAIKKLFIGPVISGGNTSIPYELSSYITDMNNGNIEYNHKCYGERVNNCYLITHDDEESENGDTIIMGACFIHGESIRYISIPLYSGIRNAKMDVALINMALVSVYMVAACNDSLFDKAKSCTVFKYNDLNEHAMTLLDISPAVIFVNVATDIFGDLCTVDDLKKAYKSSNFAEKKHEFLYGHYFDGFYDIMTINSFEFFKQCLDENFSDRKPNFAYYFIQDYLDNSKILPLYYKYRREEKIKAKARQGLI